MHGQSMFEPIIFNLRTSQGYIFFILQHLPIFAVLLKTFYSKTLFLAVVLDFVPFALIKI
jgi:hypothetical protein